MHESTSTPIALICLAAFVLACSAEPGSSPPDEAPPTAATAEPAVSNDGNEAVPAKTESSSRRNERPLPGFGGRTLDGQPLQISDQLGKRLLILFFNPESKGADTVARSVVEVAGASQDHNFRVVGVATGSSRTKALEFAGLNGLEFPIIDDSSGSITQRLNLRAPLLLLGVDPEGYVSFVMGSFPVGAPDAQTVVADLIRERMRLPLSTASKGGEMRRGPDAPLFELERLDGGDPVRLADFRGRPVVLIFFLHTCPHCHHALEFLKGALADIDESQRPVLLGVSLQNRPSAVRSAMAEAGLDYFDILIDPKEEAIQAYGVFGGVPDTFVIDKEGSIVRHVTGWNDNRDPALMRMVLAREAGVRIPMLLSKQGYTGNDVCGVCHEAELAAWEFTSHASAFATLVTHGADRNDECVGCHVVGFQQAGGYSYAELPEHLENVGCESCHGRGGPHLSPEFVKDGSYESVCATCHNPTHSLGFDYATFQPRVSHQAILAMSAEQREALASTGAKRELLPSKAAYVGSEACKSCHPAEFASWQPGPHGQALASLAADGKQNDAACLECHTTAYGREGGFPKAADPAAHPDLARVGCESCHGPGGDHIGPQARKLGSIVSLGDKCDSCVILKICGSCHDDANDPGFEFEVQEKIDRQRHGTIEAGTGKPKPALGASRDPGSAAATLARAFSLLDDRS